MKTKKLVKITFICSIALISSCSIQKRTFRSGYHIEWNKKYVTAKVNEETTESMLAVNEIEKNTTNNVGTSIEEVNTTIIASNQSDVTKDMHSSAEIKTTSSILNQSQNNNSHKQTTEATDHSEKYSNSKIQTKNSEKSKKLTRPATNGGKLQIVALILCILFGIIGVHRFYLGYTGLGILYLFTLGLFGIGWIIDLILLVIPNGLTPKGRANYKE